MYEPIVNFIKKFHKCTWGKLDEGHATWVLRQLRLNSETEMLFKKDEPSVAQIFWRSVLKFLGTTFSLVEHTCSWVERNAFLSSNSTSTLLSCNYKYTFLLNKQYISQATIYCHWLNHQATMHKLFSQAAKSHFFTHATRNTHFSQTTENQHGTLKFAKHHNSLIPSPSQVTSEAITKKHMQLCLQLSCMATTHVGHMWTSTNNTWRNMRMTHMTQSTQRNFLNTSKEQ